MMFATQKDASLGYTRSTDEMWDRRGPTSVQKLSFGSLTSGVEMVTSMIISDTFDLESLNTFVNIPPDVHFKACRIATSTQDVKTPADMVKTIRSVFELNVSEVAQLLSVERVTIYAWLKTDSHSKIHVSNRNRLHSLYRLADAWKSLPAIEGDFLHDPIKSIGKSVFELLQSENTTLHQLLQAHEALNSFTKSNARKEKHQKAQRDKIVIGADKFLNGEIKLGMDLD